MPSRVGRFEVDKVGEGAAHLVQVRRRDPVVRLGLSRQGLVPNRLLPEPVEDLMAVLQPEPRELWVELATAPIPNGGVGGFDAARSVVGLRDVDQVNQTAEGGQLVPVGEVGEDLAVPTSIGVSQCLAYWG